MSLIILESDNAERVEQTVYEDERELQDLVAEQPESIPLEDIDENRRVAVAAKEFTVDGEYADAVAFDQFGRIYIIETKLDENSDKRQVMAQAFDYGTALWDSVEATDFFEQLDEKVHGYSNFEKWAAGELDVAPASYGSFRDRIEEQLSDGSFVFVVVMNRIEDRLRTLIRYLAGNSDFDVYGVELDYYEYEDKRIVVPELYGTEVQSRASRSDDLQKATEGDLYDKFQEMLDERVAGRADVDYAGQNNYRQVLMDGVDSDIHLEWNFERIEGEDHVTVRADFECDDATVNKKLLEQFVERHLDRYEEELGESIEPHRRGSKWRRFYIARPASVGDVLHDQTLQEWAVETMHGLLLLLREDIEEELRMARTATEEHE